VSLGWLAFDAVIEGSLAAVESNNATIGMWKVEKHVESAGESVQWRRGDVETWGRCGGNVEGSWPMYHRNEGCHGP
jgi:hypothetical protein